MICFYKKQKFLYNTKNLNKEIRICYQKKFNDKLKEEKASVLLRIMSLCDIRNKINSTFEENDIKAIRFPHSAKNLLEQELEPVETRIKNS